MTSQFYTVASSLPRLNNSFKVSAAPISRAQLEKRLNLLPLKEAGFLFDLEKLVWTSWFMPKMQVIEAVKLHQKIMSNEEPWICQIVDWYLDLRSIFAALRMRHDKKETPKNPNELWICTRAMKLIHHWDEPDFGLKAVYPWIPNIAAAIEHHDVLVVEEFLLNHIWLYLSCCEQSHYFDLEYLVIYLLRWNVVNYWAQFNENKAPALIDKLCMELLNVNQGINDERE